MSNITFIIYGDINQTSGGYYYDRELIRALEREGHTLSVSEARDFKDAGPPPDLYIIDELCHPDFYSKSHFRILKAGVPVIGMVHHLAADENLSFLNRLYHLRMERRFLKQLDFVIFNSLATKDSALNAGGYRGASVIAVPGRADEENKKIIVKKKKTRLSLVFIGNLIPRKGLHNILQHLSACDNIPFDFSIAGDDSVDPSYTQALIKLINLKKLDDRVKITGYLSEEEKTNLLADSDILLMLSSHEGYGIAYIEAMRYGTIPIAGTSGGASEIIQDGENGYLIDPEDGFRFKEVLSSLSENPELKDRMSLAAESTWHKHPRWSDTFTNAISEIENLMDYYKRSSSDSSKL